MFGLALGLFLLLALLFGLALSLFGLALGLFLLLALLLGLTLGLFLLTLGLLLLLTLLLLPLLGDFLLPLLFHLPLLGNFLLTLGLLSLTLGLLSLALGLFGLALGLFLLALLLHLSLLGLFLLALLLHLSLLGLFLRSAGLFLLLLLRLLAGHRGLLGFARLLRGFALLLLLFRLLAGHCRLLGFAGLLGGFALLLFGLLPGHCCLLGFASLLRGFALLLLLFRLLAGHCRLLGFAGLLGLLFQLFFLCLFLLTAVHRFFLSFASLLGLLLKLLLAGLFLFPLLSHLLLFHYGSLCGFCLLFFPLFLAGRLFLLAELRCFFPRLAGGVGLGRFLLRAFVRDLLFLAGSGFRFGGFARLLDSRRCLFPRLTSRRVFLGFGSLRRGLGLLLLNLLLAGKFFLLTTLHRFLARFASGIDFRRFLLRPLLPSLLFLARSHFRLGGLAGLFYGGWYFRLRRGGADHRLLGRNSGYFGTAWVLAAWFALRDGDGFAGLGGDGGCGGFQGCWLHGFLFCPTIAACICVPIIQRISGTRTSGAIFRLTDWPVIRIRSGTGLPGTISSVLLGPRLVTVCGEIARSFPADLGLGLAAVVLQPLDAALVEFFTSTEFGDRLLGFLPPLFAALAEAIGDLATEVLAALDLDGFQSLLDPGGLEACVPVGIQIRRGNSETVALETRSHRQRIAAWTGIRIHIQAVKRQRSARTR